MDNKLDSELDNDRIDDPDNGQVTADDQDASRPGMALSWTGLLGLVLVALVAGVFGYWLGARGAAGPGMDSAEAGFARDMITHHAQAVDMATLIRERSDDEELRQIALDIALTQQGQIGQMQGWLSTWGDPLGKRGYPLANAGPAMAWMDAAEHSMPMATTMAGAPASGLMPGMAAPEQMNALRGLQGVEAEILFLQLMITHHVSGVEMAQAALARVERPEVRALAQSMVNAQTYEIAVMQGLLAARGAPAVEVPAAMEGGHGMPMP